MPQIGDPPQDAPRRKRFEKYSIVSARFPSKKSRVIVGLDGARSGPDTVACARAVARARAKL
jgi:hypothetical protein